MGKSCQDLNRTGPNQELPNVFRLGFSLAVPFQGGERTKLHQGLALSAP